MLSDLMIDFGLTRNEFRYILDTKDIDGTDFPGKTFRAIKEREEIEYGGYCTLRLGLLGKG
jgi:hypothetical protein